MVWTSFHAGDPLELRHPWNVPAVRRRPVRYEPLQDPSGNRYDDQFLNMFKKNIMKFISQVFDDFIFAFFWLEMSIKMVAMGVYGKSTYLADSWNRLDFFIVVAGWASFWIFV